MRSAIALALSLSTGAAAAEWPDVSTPIHTQQRAPSDSAVVIGNAQYANLSRPLPSAERDARTMAEALRASRGIPAERVDELINAGVAEMEHALERAGRSTGADGVVWVYFAGHGAAHPLSGDRMLLADETRVSRTAEVFSRYGLTLARARELASAGGAQVIFLVDACYTGLDRDGQDVTGGSRFVGTASALSTARTIQWTAASDNEWATQLDGTNHGAFTYLLLGALRGWADGVLGERPDGVVTLAEAQAYMRRSMLQIGMHRQTPELLTGAEDPGAWVLVEGSRNRFERAPELPTLSAVAAASAAVPTRPSFSFEGNTQLDVDGLAKEQACMDAAQTEALHDQERELREAVGDVAEGVRDAWQTHSARWRTCTSLTDAAARDACADEVSRFIEAAKRAKVVNVDARVYTAETECGPRPRALDARTVAARLPEVSDAERLQRQLRSGQRAPSHAAPSPPRNDALTNADATELAQLEERRRTFQAVSLYGGLGGVSLGTTMLAYGPTQRTEGNASPIYVTLAVTGFASAGAALIAWGVNEAITKPKLKRIEERRAAVQDLPEPSFAHVELSLPEL